MRGIVRPVVPVPENGDRNKALLEMPPKRKRAMTKRTPAQYAQLLAVFTPRIGEALTTTAIANNFTANFIVPLPLQGLNQNELWAIEVPYVQWWMGPIGQWDTGNLDVTATALITTQASQLTAAEITAAVADRGSMSVPTLAAQLGNRILDIIGVRWMHQMVSTGAPASTFGVQTDYDTYEQEHDLTDEKGLGVIVYPPSTGLVSQLGLPMSIQMLRANPAGATDVQVQCAARIYYRPVKISAAEFLAVQGNVVR